MIQENQFRMLQDEYLHRIQKTDTSNKRYLYHQINWDARLICIRGARGTGKTTMILQYIKEHYNNLSKALYISLDNFQFQLITLYDVAEYAHTHGIEALFVDEIHYTKHLGQMLKQVFDTFSDLKIVYTGSSMLQIDDAQADLSRRRNFRYFQSRSAIKRNSPGRHVNGHLPRRHPYSNRKDVTFQTRLLYARQRNRTPHRPTHHQRCFRCVQPQPQVCP